MVFTSLPLYHLDPPNWNQPNQHEHQQTPTNECPHLISPPSMNTQSAHNTAPGSGGGNGGGSRPGSMVERARLAKIPQPEPALKCPRCDSTNTKFCYFNNYSLSQPRHFCKTCRRYWTRGGALRNVPVGGGCRRNKRSSKSSGTGASSSKSPSSAATTAAAENRSSSSATSAGTSSLPLAPPPPPQLPFLGSMHPMMDYNIGLGFSGMQQPIDHDNSMGGLQEQWRLQSQIQQFPFLGGLESQLPTSAAMPGVYPFDGQGGGGATGAPTGLELINQLASTKMEDNHPRGLNLARQYLGVSPRNDQFWAAAHAAGGGGEGSSASGAGGNNGGGGGGWMTNLSGFNSSSTGSLL